MTIETTRDNICINQIIEQRKDNFIIEGDAIIPDIKPDILSTISTSGTICIYKKEIQNGKIKIDGTINTYIMYLADSETNNIRSINTNLDFTQTINMEKAKSNMKIENTFTLKEIECKVLNGRKVNIKAIIETETKILNSENVDIVNGIEDLKEGELLDVNKQMNKFKKDLENIINTKPQFEDTDSNKIILNSDNLKENSEFDLKSKEKR